MAALCPRATQQILNAGVDQLTLHTALLPSEITGSTRAPVENAQRRRVPNRRLASSCSKWKYHISQAPDPGAGYPGRAEICQRMPSLITINGIQRACTSELFVSAGYQAMSDVGLSRIRSATWIVDLSARRPCRRKLLHRFCAAVVHHAFVAAANPSFPVIPFNVEGRCRARVPAGR